MYKEFANRLYLWLCILYVLQFQWLLHQQHFLGEKHMNLRLQEVQINSRNTHLKKLLFSPVIGNIRLSLHTYINSLSSLFVVFFSCRWDIFWFSSILRTELSKWQGAFQVIWHQCCSFRRIQIHIGYRSVTS